MKILIIDFLTFFYFNWTLLQIWFSFLDWTFFQLMHTLIDKFKFCCYDILKEVISLFPRWMTLHYVLKHWRFFFIHHLLIFVFNEELIHYLTWINKLLCNILSSTKYTPFFMPLVLVPVLTINQLLCVLPGYLVCISSRHGTRKWERSQTGKNTTFAMNM